MTEHYLRCPGTERGPYDRSCPNYSSGAGSFCPTCREFVLKKHEVAVTAAEHELALADKKLQLALAARGEFMQREAE